MQTTIDTRAMEIAAAAAAREIHHEDECTRRYAEIISQLNRVFDRLDQQDKSRSDSTGRIYSLLWKAVGTLVPLLLTALGILIWDKLQGHV